MNLSGKFLPRLGDIFFAALFTAILLLGGRMINLDGDLPRHLTFGRLILAERTIPATEPLIYPHENRPYVSHEWLSQVIYQAVYSVAGLPGLVLLSAVLLSSTFFIIYSYLVKRLSLRLPVLFIVAWGAFATSLNWAIRPHLFSMLLLALWLHGQTACGVARKFPSGAFLSSCWCGAIFTASSLRECSLCSPSLSAGRWIIYFHRIKTSTQVNGCGWR
jgi:hypothetical protein